VIFEEKPVAAMVCPSDKSQSKINNRNLFWLIIETYSMVNILQ